MSHKIAIWRVLRVANLVQFGAGLAVLATASTGFGGMAGNLGRNLKEGRASLTQAVVRKELS